MLHHGITCVACLLHRCYATAPPFHMPSSLPALPMRSWEWCPHAVLISHSTYTGLHALRVCWMQRLHLRLGPPTAGLQ